jgi:hypothetical protein
MSDYIAVKYVRNAEERATGALTFLDDDRADIQIGGTGAVTSEEFVSLASMGIVLEELEGDEAKEALATAIPDQPRALSDLNQKDLREIASQEGVDLSGLRSNEAIIDAITENRQSQGLPATATTTGGPVIGGGAAGPGGAAAAAGATGGGPAT